MLKDPNTKAAIMQACTKAAKEAIIAGSSTEEVLIAAQNALKAMLATYRPTASTIEAGLQEVVKVREEFEARAEENSDNIVADLEINDYPVNARSKVSSRDFINTVHDLTGATVHVRGSFVEPGKRVPVGQKKLYLHIEGETKYQVTSAYREAKRVLEDAASSTAHVGTTGKYSF